MRKVKIVQTSVIAVLLAALTLTAAGCAKGQQSSQSGQTVTRAAQQSQNADEPEPSAGDQTPESADGTFSASELNNRGIGILAHNGDVYVADVTGVWKNRNGSGEKEYITDNPSTNLAFDGKTLLYVYKKYDVETAEYYVRNAEIHSVDPDGGNDVMITECSESAQPLLIRDNKLYFADYASNESFHRELFALDLNGGEAEPLARDVSFPKLYQNKIYYAEGGFLPDTSSGAKKVYDIGKNLVGDYTDPKPGSLYDYSFNDGYVVMRDYIYYYKNGGAETALDDFDTSVYLPVFCYNGVCYCVENDDMYRVEMVSLL